MRPHNRWPDPLSVHALSVGVLALLIALLFVSPERLLDPAVQSLAPASAQAQTTTDCAAQTAVPQAECEALLALYTATNGQSWSLNGGWGQNNDVCSWYGVTCTNGSVTRLDLSLNLLSGSIPPEFGNLTNLNYIHLGGNQLSGSIPPEFGNLTNLTSLDLAGNQLTGSIPPELGSLANLTYLDLAGNQLTGSISPELGSLANLQVLNLAGNQLTGSIPPELGSLTNLQVLLLSNNQLSGSIPPELGSLTNLTSLDLSRNQLTGSIPPELGNLTNLTRLDLVGNQLSSIPPELGSLTNLTSLDLSCNQLSGSIPPELGSLTNLTSLDLSRNQLSDIPPELGSLTNLTYLWLSNNQLSGSIPPELGNLANLTSLDLGGNQLMGSIPPELANLTKVNWLSLSGNYLDLSVTDPALLAWLNTRSLDWRAQRTPTNAPIITNCAAQTDVPQAECEALLALYTATNGANWISNGGWGQNNVVCLWYGVECTNGSVSSLDLSYNQLTGSIPPELGNLTNLTRLDLSYNQLTGSIPPELGNLANLTNLSLGGNQLTGSIPPELGSLTNLTRLDLGGNQLTRSIPPELGNLTNLTYLSLGGNQLSGSIPPELANLSLSRLDLRSNALSGSIPTQLANMTLFALYISNNYLDTNVTDPALLAWLDRVTPIPCRFCPRENWRNQRTPAPNDCAAQTDVPQAECEALLALYTATNGQSWINRTGWGQNNNVCSWHGVTCTSSSVTRLDLTANGLRGTLPTGLGSLNQLEVLNLASNQLAGGIPPELGSLTNLIAISLADNQISGSIPPELGNLTKLINLALSENQLTGSIPPQLANLVNVTALFLADNALDTNVTDAALLAWLDQRGTDWRNQRVPSGSVQLSTVITGTVGGELVVPRDRRVGVRLAVPAGALSTEPVTMTYTGLPLLDTPLPSNQMMSGRFVLTATSTISGSLAQSTRLMTLTVDLAPAAPQLAQTTPLSPVIYARSGAAWVPAETRCTTAGCGQQASDTQVTLLLDYVGEFAVGITPRRVYLPLVVRAQP